MGGFGRIPSGRFKTKKMPPLRNKKRVFGPKFKQQSQVLSPTKVVSGKVIDELTGTFGFRLNNNWRFAIHLSALGAPDADPPHCVLYSSRGKILAMVNGLKFGFEPSLVLKSKPSYYGNEKGIYVEKFANIWKDAIDSFNNILHLARDIPALLKDFSDISISCLLRGNYDSQKTLDLTFKAVPFDLL